MDKSLDEIIAERNAKAGAGRGGGGGGGRGRSGGGGGGRERAQRSEMSDRPFRSSGGGGGGRGERAGTKRIVVTGPGVDQLGSDADLHDMFAECGRIVSGKIEVQRGGLSNGRKRAFVEFERYDGAEKAIAEFNGAEVNHQKINVRAYKSEGPNDEARGSSGGGGGGGDARITVVKVGGGGGGGGDFAQQVRIKVDNLPPAVQDSDLRDIFASVGGNLVEARVKGAGRGGVWGVVVWEGARAHASAQTAIREFNQAEVNGCVISVQMDERQPGGGGGGYGGGGYGGGGGGGGGYGGGGRRIEASW